VDEDPDASGEPEPPEVGSLEPLEASLEASAELPLGSADLSLVASAAGSFDVEGSVVESLEASFTESLLAGSAPDSLDDGCAWTAT